MRSRLDLVSQEIFLLLTVTHYCSDLHAQLPLGAGQDYLCKPWRSCNRCHRTEAGIANDNVCITEAPITSIPIPFRGQSEDRTIFFQDICQFIYSCHTRKGEQVGVIGVRSAQNGCKGTCDVWNMENGIFQKIHRCGVTSRESGLVIKMLTLNIS